LDYDISTLSPAYKSEEGQAAYWRFGTYAPNEENKQRFYIRPVLPNSKKADEKYEFYRAFTLKATEPWIKLNKSTTYIKGTKSAIVDVWFDKNKMKKPGLYNGKVIAYRKGGLFSGSGAEKKEFELMCTVVKPLTFNETNNYTYQSAPYRIDPGNIKRLFFDIPPGASSVSIRLGTVKGKYSNIRAYLHDPDGREYPKNISLKSKKQSAYIFRLSKGELQTGTWELVLYADFRNEKSSYNDLKISFSGLEIIPDKITYMRIMNGEKPRGSLKVTNCYNKMAEIKLSGRINGYRRVSYIDEDSEQYEKIFSVDDKCDKVEFTLELEKEIFNYFTDFAINIKDISGKALKKDGLTYRKTTINFIPPASGKYILELIPGFAAKESKNWSVKLTESYYHFKKQSVSGSTYEFYPNKEKQVKFRLNGEIPVAPEGFKVFGELFLESTDINRYRIIIPIELKTGIRE